MVRRPHSMKVRLATASPVGGLMDLAGLARNEVGPGGLVKLLAGGWETYVFAHHSQFFESIVGAFSCASLSVQDKRIILRYWLFRLLVWQSACRQGQGTITMVDEGLSQTLFSTVSRFSGIMPGSREAADRFGPILDSLPVEREMFILDSSPSEVRRRLSKDREKIHPFTTSLHRDWIHWIGSESAKRGTAVTTLGESRSSRIEGISAPLR